MKKIQKYSHIIFIILTISVILFGIWGYYEKLYDKNINFLSILYSTLQMFVMETGEPVFLNWKLLVAKYLSAIIISCGIFILIYNYIAKWYDLFKIKYFYSNHNIICGLGKIGFRLSMNLLNSFDNKRKEKVVIIEQNPNNEYISEIRRCGAIVIVGNALEVVNISNAKLKKAKRLLINTGSDEENIEIANTFSDFYHRNAYRNKVKGLVHIENWSNLTVLKDYLELYHDTEKFDINIFNLHQSAAQIIFDNHVILYNKKDIKIDHINILIWGYNKTVDFFIIENLILGHFAKNKNIDIYLVDEKIDAIYKSISFKFPFIKQFLNIIPIELENEIIEFEEIYNIIEKIDAVYIFGNEDAIVINRAKLFKQMLYIKTNDISNIPIVACLPEESKIFELLDLPLLTEKKQKNKSDGPIRKNIFKDLENRFNINFIRLFSDTCTKQGLIDANMKFDIYNSDYPEYHYDKTPQWISDNLYAS